MTEKERNRYGVPRFSDNTFTTYSFTGNKPDTTSWTIMNEADVKATKDTLSNLFREKVGDSSLDPYIEKAYMELGKQNKKRTIFGYTCQDAAKELINLAKKLRDESVNKTSQCKK